MIIDFDIEKSSKSYLIRFNTNQFNSPRDYVLAVTLVTVASLDYDLDPELDEDDMSEIVQKTIELDKSSFTFCINEEGIEVDI